MNKINKIMIGILLIAAQANAKEYILKEDNSVIAVISSRGVNRIEVENDRISEVIGNEDEYTIDSDPTIGQVFIITKDNLSNNKLAVSIITEQNKVIDAKLEVKDIDPQTVTIRQIKEKNHSRKLSHNRDNYENNEHIITKSYSNDYNSNQEIIEAIKYARNNKGVDIPTLACIKDNLKFISGEQYTKYGYLIIKAKIKNISENNKELSEKEFIKCLHKVRAVSIDDTNITPEGIIDLYIVGYDE